MLKMNDLIANIFLIMTKNILVSFLRFMQTLLQNRILKSQLLRSPSSLILQNYILFARINQKSVFILQNDLFRKILLSNGRMIYHKNCFSFCTNTVKECGDKVYL